MADDVPFSLPAVRSRRGRGDGDGTLDMRAIAAAGLRVVDEEGIAELTIRRLAEELGTSATSLYRLVRGKDEILAAVAEFAFSEVEIPTAGSWDVRLTSFMMNLRQLLLEHPGAGFLNLYQPSMGPASLRTIEAILEMLAAGGYTGPRAMSMQRVLVGYTLGFTLNGLSHAGPRAEGYRAGLRSVSGAEHPRLAAIVSSAGAADSDESFALGLELLVGGLSRA